VSKLLCETFEKPIDLDTRVIRAIRFELEDLFDQLLSASCKLAALPNAGGTTTFGISGTLHYNISMNSSFGRGVRGCSTTIRSFDRDLVCIRGYNAVLPVSVKVLLADDKGWR